MCTNSTRGNYSILTEFVQYYWKNSVLLLFGKRAGFLQQNGKKTIYITSF
jgi:hypothetical protein